jgi:hypothetical protein
MTKREIPHDLSAPGGAVGRASGVVIPSAIGVPEPSGLTARQWAAQTEELLAAFAEADDAERPSATRSGVSVTSRH